MKIAISDANVAIDLYSIGALEKFLSASFFEIHITDFVFAELKDNNLRKIIESSAVTIHQFKPSEIIEIDAIKESCGISLQDSSCIYYAIQLKDTMILSGDKKLKKQAEKKYSLQVRGTIYIILEMLKEKVINNDECQVYLTQLKEKNTRMPTAEIDEIIEALKNIKKL